MTNSGRIQIAPSLLSADFASLRREIRRVTRAGADMLHLDVMDGRFVPNITFGPLIIRAVRSLTALPLDCHLMIEQPERFAERFAEAGADFITVHAEATPHVHRAVQRVAAAGAVPGVALNPSTPPEAVQDLLQHIGILLIMTVNPGFGGQKFIEGIETKVHRAAELIQHSGHQVLLEVDGGMTAETAARVVQAGARLLVSGSYIFGAADSAKAIQSLRNG